MTKFNEMTVKARLTLGFGMIAAMVMIVSGLSLKALNDSNARFRNYLSGVSSRADLTMQVRTAIDRRAIAARNLVLVTNPEDVEIEKAAVTKAREDVQSRLRELNRLSSAPGVSELARAMVAEITRIESQYG